MFKTICLAILATVSTSECDGQPVAADTAAPDLVAAVERSLRYLDVESDRWMEGEAVVQDGTGCVSCHHVGYALWSEREAERAGIRLAGSGFDDLRRRAFEFQKSHDQIVPATQMILAENHQKIDTDKLVDAKEPDGRWRARGQFPRQRRGESEGDGVATLWALVALHAIEPLDAELQERRVQALDWLDRAPDGTSNEWIAARLVVEHQAGNAARAADELDRLLAAQHRDGGWGWLIDDPSNPFSTGVALYALSVAAPDRAVQPMRAAVEYLLERQQDDGTWITPSEYTSQKASEDRDYIYRFWGTAWATIGLSRVAGLGRGEDAVGRQASADEGDGRGDRAY